MRRLRTQAAAQQAADTRDGNGDGVYCNSLPCPCAGPGQTAGGGVTMPAPKPRPPSRPKLGPSVLLGPWSKHTACRINGALPDRRCTPGARFKYVTKVEVCKSGYSKSVRNVSSSAKDAIYAEYGMNSHFDGQTGEVDHLLSLELGGSNSRANLFPEAASPKPGSHEKDRLENRLHTEVCSGQISLRQAQRLIAGDWVAVYRTRFAR